VRTLSWTRAAPAVLVAVLAVGAGAALAQARRDVPLPPPPPGTTRVPTAAPAAPAGARPAAPAAPAAGAVLEQPAVERCTGCHAALTQKRLVHPGVLKNDCQKCHRPVASQGGKCRAKTSSTWMLVQTEPELCYGCHKRMDESKSVHTVVRQGGCLTCHEAHASDHAGLTRQPREQVCFDCHEPEPLLTKPVRHAPVAEGLCLDCHDPHGSANPNAIRGAGSAFCLKCHAVDAPKTRGMPTAAYRLDMKKPVVHRAFDRVDCNGCHDGGHSGDNLKLLKKGMTELCYGCHERQDKSRFPHTAVIAGDCGGCHDPHASDQPKLVEKPTVQETCFVCHQDDLTGRKVIHAPVAKGCDKCHDPHGAPNRFALKGGEGKKACYACHQPVDNVKVKHAALERYGCTGCHDPHGTANPALLPKRVNALCSGCHEAQADGRHVTAIAAKGHPVGGDLNDPRRPGRDFSCASCHNPHGSDNPRFFWLGANALESCDGCHGDKSGKNPGLKNIVGRAKRVAPAQTGAAGGAGHGGGAGAGGGVPPPGAGSPGDAPGSR
jgi:predicted CXXCH cytochrome family protein